MSFGKPIKLKLPTTILKTRRGNPLEFISAVKVFDIHLIYTMPAFLRHSLVLQ